MASFVDSKLDYRSPSMDTETFQSYFLHNKLSREHLEPHLEGVSEYAEMDREHRIARNNRLEKVTEIFADADIKFASMKNLRAPKSMMSDIDFLIPDQSEMTRVLLNLSDVGYELVQFRLLAHPLKTMCVKPDAKKRHSMEGEHARPVDLYPEAAWIRKKVCDASKIVKRSGTDQFSSPTPEDDLYLVATHAYSHLSVKFAELYHGVRLLEETDEFDWEYLQAVAGEYGCEDAIYAYLLLLDEYLRATGREPVPEETLEGLSSTWICTLVDRWFHQRNEPVSYPVTFPLKIANVLSSIHHTPAILHKDGLSAAYKDFQSHYLVAASKLLTGET